MGNKAKLFKGKIGAQKRRRFKSENLVNARAQKRSKKRKLENNINQPSTYADPINTEKGAGSSKVPENYQEYAASVLASSKELPPPPSAEPETQNKELEIYKQIKSNLLKLRRLSESAPAPAPTLELEIFPEQEQVANVTDESTTTLLDDSKPPAEETEDKKNYEKKEENTPENNEDPYLKERTSRKRRIEELKSLPKIVKRNPRRQAVIRREEEEAIKAARNAPAIEKVYLNNDVPNTTKGRKKRDENSSNTESKLSRSEQLYVFGRYVADELISFDDKDSETAQTEIKEVLQKYRLKYKIMKCLTKPGATEQSETKTAKVKQINSNGHSATSSKSYSNVSKTIQPPVESANRPTAILQQHLEKNICGRVMSQNNPTVTNPAQAIVNNPIESNDSTLLKPSSVNTLKTYSRVANVQAIVNSPMENIIPVRQLELSSNSIQGTVQNKEPVKFVIIQTEKGLTLSTDHLVGEGKSINMQPLGIESSHPNIPKSSWPTLTLEPQLNLGPSASNATNTIPIQISQPVLPTLMPTVAQIETLPNVHRMDTATSIEPDVNVPISQSEISNENDNIPSLPHVMIMAPETEPLETPQDESDIKSSDLQSALDEEAESIIFKCEPDSEEES